MSGPPDPFEELVTESLGQIQTSIAIPSGDSKRKTNRSVATHDVQDDLLGGAVKGINDFLTGGIPGGASGFWDILAKFFDGNSTARQLESRGQFFEVLLDSVVQVLGGAGKSTPSGVLRSENDIEKHRQHVVDLGGKLLKKATEFVLKEAKDALEKPLSAIRVRNEWHLDFRKVFAFSDNATLSYYCCHARVFRC